MLNLQQWIKFISSTRIYVKPTGPKLVFYLQGKSWELIFRRNSHWNLTPTSACPTAFLSIFNNPENQRSMCILIGNELF